MNNIEYTFMPGSFACLDDTLISQCADLYSHHYGIWAQNGNNPGQRIKLSKQQIINWLNNKYTSIYYATKNQKLIGYAIAFNKNEKNYGVVTWVTQLVVHEDYRNQGIAKNILFSIWGFSNHYAWGIVSANPYAVRALEKATRRRAIPKRIKRNSSKLKSIGNKNVPFIGEHTELKIDELNSSINTEFFIEHTDIPAMIKNVTKNIPWELGALDEGWEWFAFTFNDQEQISLSKSEIENMIATSDSVVKKAYSRMDLQINPGQKIR